MFFLTSRGLVREVRLWCGAVEDGDIYGSSSIGYVRFQRPCIDLGLESGAEVSRAQRSLQEALGLWAPEDLRVHVPASGFSGVPHACCLLFWVPTAVLSLESLLSSP